MSYRLITKQDRLAARYVPEGFERFEHAEAQALVCLGESRQGLRVIVYTGTAAKPCANYVCRNEWTRLGAVLRIVAGRIASAEAKRQHKETLKAPHKLTLGQILVSSWGYDQTNVDYYQVTRVVSGRSVEVRPIKLHHTQGRDGMSDMSGYVIPCPDEFIGTETSRHIVTRDSIKVGYHQYARLWDGRPNYCSWYA